MGPWGINSTDIYNMGSKIWIVNKITFSHCNIIHIYSNFYRSPNSNFYVWYKIFFLTLSTLSTAFVQKYRFLLLILLLDSRFFSLLFQCVGFPILEVVFFFMVVDALWYNRSCLLLLKYERKMEGNQPWFFLNASFSYLEDCYWWYGTKHIAILTRSLSHKNPINVENDRPKLCGDK